MMKKNKLKIQENIKNSEKAKYINDNELWKHFFRRPLKTYNPYVIEMFEHSNILFNENELHSLKGNWNKYFNNDNDISIEIGSGSGNFITTLATKSKNENFIAFEIRFKRLVSSALKSEKLKLNNVAFVRYPNLQLSNIFKNEEITNFYMNFPEPWDNEEHKRLFSDSLLDELGKIMKENGKIFFKTDHTNYYHSICELINKRNDFKIIFKTDDLYSTELIETNIETEFEGLFINKVKEKIKYIEIIKMSN